MSFELNPFTGQFDYQRPLQESVKNVVDVYVASAVISALKLVRINGGGILHADNNIAYTDAKTLGIALNSAPIGGNVNVLMFGTVEDAFFSGMIINDPIFLGVDGALTQIAPSAPTAKYIARIGKYIGRNTVLIQIEEPTLL